jgi:uncharacterized membrane protein YhhN
MVYHLIPVPIGIALTIYYFIIKNKEDLRKNAIIQPLTTLVAIVVAALSFLSPNVNRTYTLCILVGLGLSFLGDVFNIDMKNDKILMAAIGVFMIAYTEYGVTFTVFSGIQPQDWVLGVFFLVVYILLMIYYWPGLGSFRIPVLLYGLVMPFMVWRAASTFYGDFFSLTQSILITIGTASLYIGDIEYGIHRFKHPRKLIIGPLLYEGGQLLIALSCSYFLS